MNDLLEIINKDIKEIFKLNEDQAKIYKCIRCIHSCLNFSNSILAKKDQKGEILKKMLIVYSFICNMDDIYLHDTLLADIYRNIKIKHSQFAEKYHRKCLERNNRNLEYHYNMILYYNKSVLNTLNLYNYYYENENYFNCIKLLEPCQNDYFIKKMMLLNNICDFKTLHENVGKIIDYSKKNQTTPYLLISIGMGNTLMDASLECYIKNLNVPVKSLMKPYDFNKQNYKVGIFIDSCKTYFSHFLNKNYETILFDFNVLEPIVEPGCKVIKCQFSEGNFDEIYKTIYDMNLDIVINFCSLERTEVYRILTKRVGSIQINCSNYLGSMGTDIFDYIVIGKAFYNINKNLYDYKEKKIILNIPFVLNVDFQKELPDEKSKHYDTIIKKMNSHIEEKSVRKFLVNYLYKIIKFNIRKINKGIYEKEMLIERQIKNVLEKANINDSNYEMFQSNYQKILKISKGGFKDETMISMFQNIVLPKCKQKNYFKFVVLSGSKKISHKDLIIYNMILKKSTKSVIYFLETVCLENRDMILDYFDDKERVYFIPFVNPCLNMLRLHYFDCVLDTMNYNLKNTLFDILKCQIPILSVKGTTLYNTITASVLNGMELHEAVSPSINQFIKRAISISKNHDKYLKLKNMFETCDIFKYYNEQTYTKNIQSSMIKIGINMFRQSLKDIIF